MAVPLLLCHQVVISVINCQKYRMFWANRNRTNCLLSWYLSVCTNLTYVEAEYVSIQCIVYSGKENRSMNSFVHTCLKSQTQICLKRLQPPSQSYFKLRLKQSKSKCRIKKKVSYTWHRSVPPSSSSRESQHVSLSAEMDPVLVTSWCGVSITKFEETLCKLLSHGLFIEFLYFQGVRFTLTINGQVLLNETISGKS